MEVPYLSPKYHDKPEGNKDSAQQPENKLTKLMTKIRRDVVFLNQDQQPEQLDKRRVHLTKVSNELARLLESTEKNDALRKMANKILVPAIQSNNLAAIEALIKAEVTVDTFDEEGCTALYKAVEVDDIDIVNALINAGADVNKANTSETGLTPLMLAAGEGRIEIMKALLAKGASVNATNSDGWSALMVVAITGKAEVVKVLIEHGADVNQVSKLDNTALCMAAKQGRVATVIALIEGGAEIDKQNDEGVTALMLAAAEGNTEVVKELIKRGANLDLANVEGHTALMTAATYGHFEVFDLLLTAGADPHFIDKLGSNVLLIIKSNRNAEFKKYIERIHASAEKTGIKEVSKNITRRKVMAHVWSFEGSTSIRNPALKKTVSVSLEGLDSSNLFYHIMSKDLKKFSERNPELLSSERANFLQSVLNFSADQKGVSPTIILERIRSGQPVLLNTGFREHAATALIWNGWFILCNRGGASRRPIEIHKFDPDLLDETILKMIVNIDNYNREDYEKFYFKTLPEKLKFENSPINDALEKKLLFPMQVVGNCTYQSPATAMYPLLLLDALMGNGKGELSNELKVDLHETVEKQFILYQKWLRNQELAVLERLIPKGNDKTIQLDHKLIQRGFRKAFAMDLDAKQTASLTKMLDNYERFLSGKDRLFVDVDIRFWKTIPKTQRSGQARDIE